MVASTPAPGARPADDVHVQVMHFLPALGAGVDDLKVKRYADDLTLLHPRPA